MSATRRDNPLGYANRQRKNLLARRRYAEKKGEQEAELASLRGIKKEAIGAVNVLCVLCAGVALASLLGDRTRAMASDRAAHYVLRSSDLNATLGFLTGVLGMRVLRHEENPQRCPITCNGPFNNPWSKTMVGYEPEHEAYALEITYNYGKTSYGGSGASAKRALLGIRVALGAATLARAPAAASRLGFGAISPDDAGGGGGRPVRVRGPDGYAFELVPVSAAPGPGPPPARTVPDLPRDGRGALQHKPLVSIPPAPRAGIVGVTLRVSSRQSALRFYSALGFRSLDTGPARHLYAAAHTDAASGDANAAEMRPLHLALGGNRGDFALTLVPGPTGGGGKGGGSAVRALPEVDGRHAIAMRESMVYSVYSRVQSGEIGGGVVHEIRELDEVLGKLVIAIVRDPDGHELCLVSSRSFDAATERATDYIGPDWSRRAQNAQSWLSGGSQA